MNGTRLPADVLAGEDDLVAGADGTFEGVVVAEDGVVDDHCHVGADLLGVILYAESSRYSLWVEGSGMSSPSFRISSR